MNNVLIIVKILFFRLINVFLKCLNSSHPYILILVSLSVTLFFNLLFLSAILDTGVHVFMGCSFVFHVNETTKELHMKKMNYGELFFFSCAL